MIKKWRTKRAGKWVAEDRLRAALFGAIWLLPLSVALFGVVNAYIDGTRGLVVCFVCLFMTGIGVSFQRFYNRERYRTNRRLTSEDFPLIGEDLASISLRTDASLSTQVNLVLTPIITYNVDAIRAHSSEVVSAHL